MKIIEDALELLIKTRVEAARKQLKEEIMEGLNTNPNAKRFPPSEYVRLYH